MTERKTTPVSEDRSGNPVVNSAGEPFDPVPEWIRLYDCTVNTDEMR